MPIGHHRWSKSLQIGIWVAAAGLLAENIVLARQNRELKNLPAEQVHAGQQLRNLAAVGLDGQIRPIGVPGSGQLPVVIATFSPTCPFCRRTEPVWAALSESMRKRGIRMIWISRDSVAETKKYCERTGIPISEVLADPPYRTFRQLGLEFVPLTLVVGPGGVVERKWSGLLDSTEATKLLAGIAPSDRSGANANGNGPRRLVSQTCCELPAQ